MPRASHKPAPEEAREDIRRRLNIFVPNRMLAFLEVEAKRMEEATGKKCHPADVVRALITSYYEKRVAGLLVSPDD
jgi:hypothetical protein